MGILPSVALRLELLLDATNVDELGSLQASPRIVPPCHVSYGWKLPGALGEHEAARPQSLFCLLVPLLPAELLALLSVSKPCCNHEPQTMLHLSKHSCKHGHAVKHGITASTCHQTYKLGAPHTHLAHVSVGTPQTAELQTQQPLLPKVQECWRQSQTSQSN